MTLYSDSGCTTAASSGTAVTDCPRDDYRGCDRERGFPRTAPSPTTRSNAKHSKTSACSSANVSYTYDTTAPTLVGGLYTGTTVTLAMSEKVWGDGGRE